MASNRRGMMKTVKRLLIEFRYFDRNTCSRCRVTNSNVEKTLRNLREVLKKAGIESKLKVTKLPASRIHESNSILINGRDVETLVNKGKNRRFTLCRGCSTLISGPCDCRAYTYHGRKYRYVPKAMIREAVQKVLGRSV